MKVVHTFKHHPLRSARDLRELRTQLRIAGNEVRANAKDQFEFICACTAVARTMLHRPGERGFSLDIVQDDSHRGLRATFKECTTANLDEDASVEIERAIREPLHPAPGGTGHYVDQVDIRPDGRRRVVASLVKWVS